MRQRLKHWLFALLGKDPEAVVVSFCSGDPILAERMAAEVRELVPDRRHYFVKPRQGSAFRIWLDLRAEYRHLRIGLAPVLFTHEPSPLRLAAFLLAPRKILAFNARLERHHLRLGTWIASLLFLRGVPVDRIFLRPFKRNGSVIPSELRIIDGRPLTPGRPRIAVVSPYFPWPLSHGGAVRIFHLLREAAREFDVFLFAFTDGQTEADYAPVAAFCAKLVLAGRPRYREPRWSTLLPPEVHEFESPALREALARFRREFDIRAIQVEYTQLARYPGDILVEHDVTYDLFNQVRERRRTLTAWWDYFRWHRFERRALRRFPHIVVMSEKDRAMAGTGEVIENGVDLDRFRPVPEPAARRLLFIGSFRHFPNVAAFRFFAERVWPLLRARDIHATIVCGPGHLTYWQAFTGQLAPLEDERITLLGYVADVRPLYEQTNLVIVPTTVSAGTNVKVLEAMAMERAVVSTTSGCAGLGLEHGRSVWIADAAEDFAAGIARLIEDAPARAAMARAARLHAERHFDWRTLGQKQRVILRRALKG
jgi:glycosyltransferase involved in cell wall biosynthesis